MTSIWIVVAVCILIAVACGTAVYFYGRSQEDAQPMSTDEELSYSLRPRDLTEKEMHDATLKGALSYIRIPVK